MRIVIAGFIAINVLVLVLQLVLRSSTEELPEPQAAPPMQELAGAPRIKLLGELDASVRDALRLSGNAGREADDGSSTSLCTLVGPFEKILRAEYFVEHLTALEVQAQVQELEIPGEPGYWVFLPSQGTSKQAFSKLRELQAKGVESYVIPGGELENGISLGMFSQEALAIRRLEAMKAEGYEADIKQVVRSYQEVWVVMQPGQVKQLSQESWQKMLIEEEGELELRQNYCPVVASE